MSTPTATSDRPRAGRISGRGKLLTTLFVAQACGSAGHSIGMAVGGIMAADITGTNTWVGLPVAAGALGAALASWPLSSLMGRTGRRPGLALGYGVAVGGAVLTMLGAAVRSFPLMLVGMALFGVSNTSNLLARYAAADVSPGAERGRAMGLIVWGSALGSVIGPNLMGPAVRAGDWLGLSREASAFLISVTGYAIAAVLVEVFLRPDPLAIARALPEADGRSAAVAARSFSGILADARVQIALAALSISQFVMISTTSTSPVYLHDHGHGVSTIGIAVAFHLGGMYVTSPLSGWLSDRFGRVPMIGVGALLLIVAVGVAGLAPGRGAPLVILGLFLNGVGWNLAFVSASALLTDALSPAERTSIQGIADLFMGLMGAVGSVAGGMILGIWGFAALNALGALLVFGPLLAALARRPALAAFLAVEPVAARGAGPRAGRR